MSRDLDRRSLLMFSAGAGLAACQTSVAVTVAEQPTGTGAVPVTRPAAVTPASTQALEPGFEAWLAAARAEALRRGITGATLDRALAGLAPIQRVIDLDRQQPEFTQTFWRYFDGAVSEKRIAAGRAKLREHAALLARIEHTHGVPRRILTAFWGLETNYGGNLGSFPTIGALSTLAFEGRRAAFFRAELMNALTILDRGHAPPETMVGSWAGAMGQTQFMPSTFLLHAIDYDGDQRIDVWQSAADALGSGANYLKNLGWDASRAWGREVRLPTGFDPGLASIDTAATETVRPLAAWSQLGLRRADGGPLPVVDIDAALVLPAGASGPAFLVYENYRTILKWNRSTLYAIAIGHLSDRLGGGGPLGAPRSATAPLARADVLALQEALSRRGLMEASGVDGVLGSGTRRALRNFQKTEGMPADGYVDSVSVKDLLRRLAEIP